MKKWEVILASLVFIFGAFLLSSEAQFASTSMASIQNPLTPPLTTPLTYFIHGTVSYKFKFFLKPAPNINVEATNTQSGEIVTELTDQNGEYAIGVQVGSYSVRAFDSEGTRFRPTEILVDIIDSDLWGISFIGSQRSSK